MAHLNLVMIHPFRDGNGRNGPGAGRGSWQPTNDATLWVKFNLRAHHMRVTKPSYVKLPELDERTATRDLVKLAELGVLERPPVGA